MKKYFVILLFISELTISQEVNDTSFYFDNIYQIDSIDPLDSNFNDLNFLQEVFQGVDVVLLGEQAHGEGSVTLAKTRLIKYLIEEQGFNIIAFESGFFGTYLAEYFIKNQQNPELFIQNSIGPIWANTLEFKEMQNLLINNIRSNKLKLYGVDCQLTSLDYNTYMNSLKSVLNKNDYSIDSTLYLLLTTYLFPRNLSQERYFLNDSDSITFFKGIDELLAVTSKFQISPNSPNDFYYQTLKNYLKNVMLTIDNMQHTPMYVIDNLRDAQMADNLLWILKHKSSGDKLIVWSASMHNARNIKSIKEIDDSLFYNKYIPMGQIIYDSIGNRMYSLAFSSSFGYFQTPYMMNEPKMITSKSENSIESLFIDRNIKYGIINFRTIPIKTYLFKEMYSNPHGHKNVKAIWPLIHDGIFYLNTIQPPHISAN